MALFNLLAAFLKALVRRFGIYVTRNSSPEEHSELSQAEDDRSKHSGTDKRVQDASYVLFLIDAHSHPVSSCCARCTDCANSRQFITDKKKDIVQRLQATLEDLMPSLLPDSGSDIARIRVRAYGASDTMLYTIAKRLSSTQNLHFVYTLINKTPVITREQVIEGTLTCISKDTLVEHSVL